MQIGGYEDFVDAGRVSAQRLKGDLIQWLIPKYAFVGEIFEFQARFGVSEDVWKSSALRGAISAPASHLIRDLDWQLDGLGLTIAIGR
jgi:hypothetical protein